MPLAEAEAHAVRRHLVEVVALRPGLELGVDDDGRPLDAVVRRGQVVHEVRLEHMSAGRVEMVTAILGLGPAADTMAKRLADRAGEVGLEPPHDDEHAVDGQLAASAATMASRWWRERVRLPASCSCSLWRKYSRHIGCSRPSSHIAAHGSAAAEGGVQGEFGVGPAGLALTLAVQVAFDIRIPHGHEGARERLALRDEVVVDTEDFDRRAPSTSWIRD